VDGQEVRRIRKRLGLTQAEFGEVVGVARNSVARWERNEMAIREPIARLIRVVGGPATGGRAATRKRRR
jgi:DNA-binding transcriptional regulator YiaG